MIVNNNYYAEKCKFGSRTWFDIGLLIYYLSDGSDEGYRLWLTYSVSDQENYNEDRCYNLWSDFDCFIDD